MTDTTIEERQAQREALVLDGAMRLALRSGYRALTRDAVAAEAGVSMGLVNRAFGTIERLREEVMRRAVLEKHAGIVAAGLADGSSIARNAPEALKKRALAELT